MSETMESVVDDWGFKYSFNFDDITISKTSSNVVFLRKALEKSLIFSSFINKNGSSGTEALIKAMNGIKISKGQIVVKEGCTRPHCFYILEKGRLSLHKTITSGDTKFALRLHQELCAGDLFGDMAFIHNCPRSATILAEEDSILWCLSGILFCKVFCVFLKPISATRNASFDFSPNVLDAVFILFPIT